MEETIDLRRHGSYDSIRMPYTYVETDKSKYDELIGRKRIEEISVGRKQNESSIISGTGTEDLASSAEKYFGTSFGYKGSTADVDIMIDATGADPIIDYYLEHGKVDSRMVMVAVGTNVRPVDVLGMTFGQLALIRSGGYTPDDVRDVMSIMESGEWDIESLITHEYPWEQLEEAIQMAGSDVCSFYFELNRKLLEKSTFVLF